MTENGLPRSADVVVVGAGICGVTAAEAVARRVLATGGVAGLRGPTVAGVFPKDAGEGDWFALTVVVGEDALLPTVEALRRTGASDVTVIPVRYVFESKSWTYEALKRQLHGPPDLVKTTAWSSS